MEHKLNEEPKTREDLIINLGGTEVKAKYRVFKSGRVGYGAYGIIKINGQACRLSLNIIEM